MNTKKYLKKIKLRYFYLISCIFALGSVLLKNHELSVIATFINAVLGLWTHAKGK